MLEIIKAQCRYCHKPLVLKVDSSFMDLTDGVAGLTPEGVMKLAACNSCADLRNRRRKLNEALGILAYRFEWGLGEYEKNKEQSGTVLKSYLELISDWVKADPALPWDDEILTYFVRSPKEMGSVIDLMWKMGKQSTAQKQLL